MNEYKWQDLLPKQGFIKTRVEKKSELSKQEKTALNRKGNEAFNNKRYDLAKKIFITTGYTDGLIRLGNYYYENSQPLEALRMFYLAPYSQGIEKLTATMAGVLNFWLRDGNERNEEE